MPKYTQQPAKSILLIRKYIDNWFWTKYGINPYNGCEFACIYCDSRSSKYYLPSDFGSDIRVKINAAELLDKKITGSRVLLPDVAGIGGTTDPYQPAEARFKITRSLIEVLLKHHWPLEVLTKSSLILRDLDLLKQTARDSWCTTAFTVTTADVKTSRFLEPHAPLSISRLSAIARIKKEAPQIQSGVLFMPQVPGITDSCESISMTVKACKDAGAEFMIYGGGMTMRDTQALYFMKVIKENKPELIPLYEKIYGFQYDSENFTGSYAGNDPGALAQYHYFLECADKEKMAIKMRRYIPDDFRKVNYILSEKLLDHARDVQMEGKDGMQFFWLGQNIQNLSEDITGISVRGNLRTIRGVGEKQEQWFLREIEKINKKMPTR